MPKKPAPPPLQPAGRLQFYRNLPATGLEAAVRPHPDVDVSVGGLQVGSIRGPRPNESETQWSLRLCVKAPELPCGFRWKVLQQRWPSEFSAREWLQKNSVRVRRQFALHQLED